MNPVTGSYRDLLEAFFTAGYVARRFDDFEPDQRHLLLRHDIDMSIARALELAELEHQMGVSSSYFVMITNELYNAFCSENARKLRKIIELGHDVGLHIDLAIYDIDEATYEQVIRREVSLLEQIVDTRVTLVSYHRPATLLQGVDYERIRLPGLICTYEPRYFREIGFCSDSRGGWYHGHPLDHEAVAAGRALQLVTHPIWWTAEGAETARDVLMALVDRVAAETHQHLRDNFKILSDD